jgi:hypothetical protein
VRYLALALLARELNRVLALERLLLGFLALNVAIR